MLRKIFSSGPDCIMQSFCKVKTSNTKAVILWIRHLFTIRLFGFVFCLLIIVSSAFGGAVQVDDTTITLFWTAPGDDWKQGRASVYDIRYSLYNPSSDTSFWWDNAIIISNPPEPYPAGCFDSVTITGLESQQVYYFGMKTSDDVMNWSDISNIISVPDISCADVNGDGVINIFDIAYLTSIFYSDGPMPVPPATGDLDNSGTFDVLDAIYLISYKFKGGPPPICQE